MCRVKTRLCFSGVKQLIMRIRLISEIYFQQINNIFNNLDIDFCRSTSALHSKCRYMRLTLKTVFTFLKSHLLQSAACQNTVEVDKMKVILCQSVNSSVCLLSVKVDRISNPQHTLTLPNQGLRVTTQRGLPFIFLLIITVLPWASLKVILSPFVHSYKGEILRNYGVLDDLR